MVNSQLGKGIIWSAIDRFSVVGIQVVFEILMARILSPQEYGLMGLLLVVISFTQIFVDSGFGNALIFKKGRTETDFSTAFYTSVITGLVIYILLFLFAPYLSNFFNKEITLYIRVIGIGILLNSLAVIYKTRLTIIIDFKSQAKFSFFAVLISGIIGIIIAYLGYGIWALICQNVALAFFNLFFLYINLKWLPKLEFSKRSFFDLFNYGSKLLYAAIINAIYINMNSVLLGKFYSTKALGIYTKSYQFTIYPISMLTGIIQRVFFPYLMKFQEDYNQLYSHNNKYNKLIFIILLPIVTLVTLLSHFLIKLILSDQWVNMTVPFNILLVSTLFYPLIIMNMNIFQVIGKTSRFLFVEILTKIIGLTIIIIFYNYGLIGICIGILIQFILQYIVTSFFVANSLQKNFYKTLNILIYFLIAIIIYLIGDFISRLIENVFLKILFAVTFILLTYTGIFYKLYRLPITNLYVKLIEKK
ncbi:lipopolysaccharide biosynthesis protein [Epilithonimonas pallida]|uniref:Membrane protein involved in the export of O-antigen and teichoic acid n=1 Tax=Epilithonimonas pallida TaxID=373671 RepID=A0ABY1R442_9FLAO|nr:lipopolysaccharide biosynthesis protein [Epilithonimonas pallida]SMP94825.1 Membrane protein involved in the export of O-antigen and teichoic acid [Epilithonimonas pallida]